ncbi:MAG: AgmX/PglI C-terminal domain-containing protein [Gemmatimonadaceae bacterium]
MRGRIRIAIACAGLLATSAASTRAQTTFRETGSVTVGGYIVWVRGTSANMVELFVGRGFRDAFAQAHEMDAAKLQHWIDSVRAIAPLPADDSSAVDARASGAPMGGGVTMTRRVGGSYSGLRLMVTGEEPIVMAEPTARDFLAMLDSAAYATHDLSPAATMIAVATTSVVVPMPTRAPVTTAAPTPATIPTPVAVRDSVVVAVAVAPPPARIVLPAAPPAIGVKPATPDSMPNVPLGATTSEVPPELVLPAPSEPVILLASRVDVMPLPLPAPKVAPAPVLAAKPAPVADTVPQPVATAAPMAPVAPAAPAQPAVPADKLIHTPLGPFTIPGALLSDRDKEVQYCYTQLGLKYNPDLKGEITVTLVVGSDGAVSDAVVTKRSWQGISAGEVESCVRALAHDWTFASSDPATTDGAKLLTFSFAP